jgi:hypothetical protein
MKQGSPVLCTGTALYIGIAQHIITLANMLSFWGEDMMIFLFVLQTSTTIYKKNDDALSLRLRKIIEILDFL